MTAFHVLGTLAMLGILTYVWLRSRRVDPPVD
jgi:hypothetical protein